jgi:hypothetical protein
MAPLEREVTIIFWVSSIFFVQNFLCDIDMLTFLYHGTIIAYFFVRCSDILHRGNHSEVEFSGGQESIIHLVSDLRRAVDWAESNGLRWAFTNSNAGSLYFEDNADLSDLDKIDWEAVQARQWSQLRERKQAEFLLERCFHCWLIEKIGVYSSKMLSEVSRILANEISHLPISVERSWYY